MDTFEQQTRACTRSWKALLGAVATTVVLFVSLSSISLVVRRPEARAEPALSYVNVPPPPPPPEKELTMPPLSSSLAEAFKFDPSTAGPPPEIPLELLDIRFEPTLGDLPELGLDLQPRFQVKKPEGPPGFTVLERDEVDEIPVWLYGPQPSISTAWFRQECDIQVLFIVNEKGRTENIYILDSTSPQLNEPVKAAIRRWVFQPARKNGRPVAIWVQQLVTYRPSMSPFML